MVGDFGLVPEEGEGEEIDCATRPDLKIICHADCHERASQLITLQIGDHYFVVPVCQFHLDEVERHIEFPAT